MGMNRGGALAILVFVFYRVRFVDCSRATGVNVTMECRKAIRRRWISSARRRSAPGSGFRRFRRRRRCRRCRAGRPFRAD